MNDTLHSSLSIAARFATLLALETLRNAESRLSARPKTGEGNEGWRG